jgi:hypothetical protein
MLIAYLQFEMPLKESTSKLMIKLHGKTCVQQPSFSAVLSHAWIATMHPFREIWEFLSDPNVV